MTKPNLKINAQDDGPVEVYMYDNIGPSWMGMVGAKDLASQLQNYKGRDLEVHLNSPGGDVFEGLAIYNLLNQHTGTVTVHIDGLAASIASVIAMAGDEVIIAENASYMIHNPWTIAAGESADLRKIADVMDQVKAQVIDIYAKRTGMDDETLARMMDEETWFTGEEAIENGFATKLTENKSVQASFDPKLYGFKKAPESLTREENRLADAEKAPNWQAQLRKRHLQLEEIS